MTLDIIPFALWAVLSKIVSLINSPLFGVLELSYFRLYTYSLISSYMPFKFCFSVFNFLNLDRIMSTFFAMSIPHYAANRDLRPTVALPNKPLPVAPPEPYNAKERVLFVPVSSEASALADVPLAPPEL